MTESAKPCPFLAIAARWARSFGTLRNHLTFGETNWPEGPASSCRDRARGGGSARTRGRMSKLLAVRARPFRERFDFKGQNRQLCLTGEVLRRYGCTSVPTPAPYSTRRTHMECPRCQRTSPADAGFCEDCGARLEITCPGCGEACRGGAKFCRKCGQLL